MELKINLPPSMWDYKLSGVYKITFEDGFFYIGCSCHLRSRASAWESVMITGKGIAGKDIGTNMINKIRELNHATFDILEMCHQKELKEKEAFYLDKYKDDNSMVSWEHGAWKPVLQYTDAGIFVKKFFSTQSAARYNNFRLSAVQRVLAKERKSHKQMVFVYEYEYQERRREIIRGYGRKYASKEKKNGRKVVKLDLAGNRIADFKTYVAAAKSVGVTERSIRAALFGERKTAGGFVFKFDTP